MPKNPITLVVSTRVVDVQGPGSASVDSNGNINYKPELAPNSSTHCMSVVLGEMTVSTVVFPADSEDTGFYGRNRSAGSNCTYLDSLTAVPGHVMSDGEINPDAPDGTITYLRKPDTEEPASTQ